VVGVDCLDNTPLLDIKPPLRMMLGPSDHQVDVSRSIGPL